MVMAGKRFKTLTKTHYDQARRLAANGLNRGMIAQALGMSQATLYRRADTDAKLRAALEAGDADDLQLCVSVLREKALAGSHLHMDRYLQLRHGVYIGGAKPNGFEKKDTQIVVVMPFETGQAGWQEQIEGEFNHIIEQENGQSLIQEHVQESSDNTETQ
jgi:hypothetical protein